MKITYIVSGSSFKRALKRTCMKNPNFLDTYKNFFNYFVKNPKDPKYQVHKLKEDLTGYYSAKIEYDLRLIFSYKNEEITLIDIGTHDQVY